jgi:hypothetical protein
LSARVIVLNTRAFFSFPEEFSPYLPENVSFVFMSVCKACFIFNTEHIRKIYHFVFRYAGMFSASSAPFSVCCSLCVFRV